MPITFKSDGIKFLKSPTFDLSSSAFVTDEGTSVAFTFTTDGPDGTFYWKTGGTVGAADFTDYTTSGTFSTSAGVANIVRTLRNDLLTEGTETVQLQVLMGSYTGTLLATSSFVDVNDTSLTQYSLTASTGSVSEGGSVTFTFTTTGPDGTFYWTNGGTSTGADFTDGLTNGSFATTAGTGSIVRTLNSDFQAEGTETLVLSVRSGSISGVTLVSSTVNIADTSIAQYSLAASTGSVSEGGSVTFTFTTTGPDGTFYWTNGGTSTGADFTDGLMSGTFITAAGTGSILRTLRNDQVTEGSETIAMNVRNGSFSGTVLASSSVNIVDTSLTQYAITNSVGSVNEGSSVTFTFTFTTAGPDETFYWTNVGSATTSDFTDSVTSGSFITTAGTGSIVRTLRNDTTTEGSESVQIQIRSGSFSGTVVALSSAVTVNDTSLTPSYAWTPENIGVGSPYRSSMVWLDMSGFNMSTPVGEFINGAKISDLYDRSGNGHNASQSTSAKQPTLVLNALNGRNVLRFNGTNDGASLINNSATYGGVYAPTIFAVASKTGAATSFRCIANLGTNNFNAFFGTSTDNFSTFFGNGVSAWNDTNVNTPLTTSTRNNFNILCVTNDYNTKLATPFVNGTAQNAKNGTMNNSSTGYKIGESAGTTQNFPGDIAEIIIVPTAIFTTDIRQRIEGYLAHKWGLASKLAANHPYKNSPPMV